MKRGVVFGQSKTTEDATRNIILCEAFNTNTKEMIYNTSALGAIKPYWSPFFKFFFTLFFAPVRWIKLSYKYFFLPQHDFIFVPYPSSCIDGWLACILGKIGGKKIILDAFLGLYDTIVNDRKLIYQNTISAKLIWYYEKWFLSEADLILTDTDLNKEMLKEAYHLPDVKIRVIPVGIDENIWKPFRKKDSSKFRVTFWCTFIPLHGVEIVAKAAVLLEQQAPDIEVVIIGTGQKAQSFRDVLKVLKPKNLKWIERFIGINEIYSIVKNSHCCLGIFGNSDKSNRVIPYKAYQALACAQPLITARTDASERIFSHEKDAFLVNPNDSEDLAKAIFSIYQDEQFAIRLGQNGRILYENKLSKRVIVNEIKLILKEIS